MGHRQLVGLVPPALAEPVRLVIQKSYCVSPGKDPRSVFKQLVCASIILTIIQL